MWKPLTLLAILGAATGHAQAQDEWDVWETKSEAEAAVAGSTADGAPVTLIWQRFGLSTNRVLDSGLEIRGAVAGLKFRRITRDAPASAGCRPGCRGVQGLARGSAAATAQANCGPGSDS